MFIHRNFSAIIIVLFVILVLSAANYRGIYAAAQVITSNNTVIQQAPSAPQQLKQLSPPIQDPNAQARASNAANTPQPINPTNPPGAQAALLNSIFQTCTSNTNDVKHSTLATYTIEGTVSLGKLQDNPTDVNVTIFNDLGRGTLSGKVFGPDNKAVSNFNIKGISTTCESSATSTPLFKPIPPNPNVDVLTQDNPPTRECPDQSSTAIYTITNVPLKQIATHGHQHITLKIFSNLNDGRITGSLLSDGDPLVKFGNNNGVHGMVDFKDVTVTTRCIIAPNFNSG
jgi:hypothetical protein